MTRTTSVSSHTRRLPEKAPDPFAKVIEAKRATFARKWGVELIGANDSRLSKPLPEPTISPARQALAKTAAQLADLARNMGWKG